MIKSFTQLRPECLCLEMNMILYDIFRNIFLITGKIRIR